MVACLLWCACRVCIGYDWMCLDGWVVIAAIVVGVRLWVVFVGVCLLCGCGVGLWECGWGFLLLIAGFYFVVWF